MQRSVSYGLEQARIQLPAIVAKANAGVASVITRHGRDFSHVTGIDILTSG
jgi:antitoxin (DNA-binding transcriptional repressor) of toxin-antitoxin stability system